MSEVQEDAFIPFEIQMGLLCDLSESPFPTKVFGLRDDELTLAPGATHYGMVVSGGAILHDRLDRYRLRAGMFFCWPGAGTLRGPGCTALIVSRLDYLGLRQVGGPLESTGRLRYIDGCTDTLLVCPPRLGEPCLNHLHIPPGTAQSQHTHPSERLGVILRGRGECRTPSGVWELKPGMAWRIPTGSRHSFYTTDSSLDVIAWHPDSDFGPTDTAHPMINKTILLPRPQ